MFIRFIVLMGILGWSVRGLSQDHFIYLQSENKHPFYVKRESASAALTSSTSGYLILPKVPQGAFSFWVGFPDSSSPDQHFQCTISADKGFLIKRFPEKGWALYDLQELTLIYADTAANQAPAVVSQAPAPIQDTPVLTQAVTKHDPVSSDVDTGDRKASNGDAESTAPADAFGNLLEAATKDTTLKAIKYVKKAPPKPSLSSGITLVSKEVTDSGVHLVFTDKQASGKVDTVQVIYPAGGAAAGITTSGGATSGITTSGGAASGITTSGAAAGEPHVQATPPGSASMLAQSRPDPPTVHTDSPAVPAPVHVDSPVTIQTPRDTVAAPTPVDTTQAFNPKIAVRVEKNKDTSNLLVPVFKNPGKDTSLTAGFGVQPGSQPPPSAPAQAAPAQSPPAQSVPTQPVPTQSAPAEVPPTTAIPDSAKTTANAGRLVNTDCKHVADDGEYQKLQKKMASESDVNKMIDLARKAFKKSCFTTDQVKNLSFLFSQEDGKFKFMEEAYPYVSDGWNFKSLQSLFTSKYFVDRFKALVEVP